MNREQTTQHNEAARRAREEELGDVLQIMQTRQGRRFIWRLLEKAMVFRTTFTGNSTTFFNEGRRSIGLEVLGDVHQVALTEYMQMMEEQSRV